jgi:hypothetical protein
LINILSNIVIRLPIPIVVVVASAAAGDDDDGDEAVYIPSTKKCRGLMIVEITESYTQPPLPNYPHRIPTMNCDSDF